MLIVIALYKMVNDLLLPEGGITNAHDVFLFILCEIKIKNIKYKNKLPYDD